MLLAVSCVNDWALTSFHADIRLRRDMVWQIDHHHLQLDLCLLLTLMCGSKLALSCDE